jgi:hypothetical protein
MIMVGPRVYAKMAEDKVFPNVFRFQGDVPRAAIALQAVAGILVVAFSTLKTCFHISASLYRSAPLNGFLFIFDS